MLRLKTVSSLLVYGTATLIFLVLFLHLFTPSYHSWYNGETYSNELDADNFFSDKWLTDKVIETVSDSTKTSTSTKSKPEIAKPTAECPEKSVTIEQYRTRSIVRGVVVRFPSVKQNYHFVQFRWFYRSWIESEMFTLDRWRTDILVMIDDRFSNDTRQLLEDLNCHAENRRTSRRQISRCILVDHKLFFQRSETERQNYSVRYQMLNRTRRLMANVEQLFGIYDYTSQLNTNQTVMYDFIMITTMNTFLTTQFGKYIPIQCSFLLGVEPEYSTWYSKTERIIEFAHTLLLTLREPFGDKKTASIDYLYTIEMLQTKILFLENQVDIPTDSTKTTYRTSIYHLKSFPSSTSLFSEKMFRNNAYDGHEKEPFNIYIAREYAALMALQSKSMSLNELRLLAANVTRRDVLT